MLILSLIDCGETLALNSARLVTTHNELSCFGCHALCNLNSLHLLMCLHGYMISHHQPCWINCKDCYEY